jgi:hypothetical protein
MKLITINMRAILEFVFFTLLISCSENSFRQNASEYQSTAYHRVTLNKNDTIYRFQVDKPDFDLLADNKLTYFWYVPDTILQTQGKYEGMVLDGFYNVFYPSKNLLEAGEFQEGLKTGVWKNWFETGFLRKTTTWKNGKKNGPFTEYDSSGTMCLSGNYANDIIDGKVIEYSADGKKKNNKRRDGHRKESQSENADSLSEFN